MEYSRENGFAWWSAAVSPNGEVPRKPDLTDDQLRMHRVMLTPSLMKKIRNIKITDCKYGDHATHRWAEFKTRVVTQSGFLSTPYNMYECKDNFMIIKVKYNFQAVSS